MGGTDRGGMAAGATEVGATAAGATEAGVTGAGATEAGATEPGATEPCATEAGATAAGVPAATGGPPTARGARRTGPAPETDTGDCAGGGVPRGGATEAGPASEELLRSTRAVGVDTGAGPVASGPTGTGEPASSDRGRRDLPEGENEGGGAELLTRVMLLRGSDISASGADVHHICANPLSFAVRT
ncbi:MAG: hypothetical protein LBH13_07955 [Cellulomonadaceae bacterium]|jgi:hypothetical protein|nr:hypothetical protein [Cellulomonadaceae bacterium]